MLNGLIYSIGIKMIKDTEHNVIYEGTIVIYKNKEYTVNIIDEDIMILDSNDDIGKFIRYRIYDDKICYDLKIVQ